ncbi:ribosomal RNA-processing protein 36 [Marchantia polymorpha subsp. ruderalis]
MGRASPSENESEEESGEESPVSEEENGLSGSEENSEDSDSDAEGGIQEQVADVPFEDLQKLKSDGRTTLFSRSKQKVDTKRANKNRPMEVTSKRPVGRFREVIQAPKRVIRDPRFESLCGNFDESRFKTSYSFLYENELPAERERLRALIKKGKADEEAKRHIEWIDKQLKEEEQRKKQASKASEQKAVVKQAVKEGKKPYFPKKSELKKQELVEKYKELKSSGKLEKFMAKRRKKNAAKDHRFVPYRRSVNQSE